MTELDLNALLHNFPDRYQVVANDPPRWTILAVSDKYTETVGKTREYLVGKPLFEAFPPDPDMPGSGREELEESFLHAVERKEPHEMSLLRYNVVDDETGHYETRWWRVTNAPIFDDDGHVVAVLNRPEDVTELKSLQDVATVRQDKASRLGAFLLERGALLAAAVFLGFIALGVVAWGLAESNRGTKERVAELEKIVEAGTAQSEQNEALLKELKTSQDLLKDCSTPGGECFEAQIAASSVGAALASISGSVMEMLECALPEPAEQRDPAFLAACRARAEAYQASVIAEKTNGGN